MKNTKKLLAVILAVLMLVSATPITIFAEDCLHENTTESTIDADCTNPKTINTICTDCKEIISSETEGEALGHSFGEYISDDNATCTADGSKTAKCENCEAIDTIPDEGTMLDHSFIDYVSNNDATCTADGSKTAKCENCEAIDTIPDEGTMLDHSFIDYVSNNDATCTADGTKTAKCENCDAIDTIPDEGTMLDHSFVDYVSNNDATCTADGTKTAKCENCEAIDTIPDEGTMLDHSFIDYVSNNDATCTADGSKTAKCENCEAIDTIPDEGTAKGHTYGEPVWNWAEDGSKATATFECTICADEENHTRVYDANVSSQIEVDSTCTVVGDTRYTASLAISETADTYTADSYTDSIVVEGDIPVKNHVYGEPVWTWAEDGSKATATFECTVCTDEENHTRVYDANVSSQIEVDSTCTVVGDTRYTASLAISETADAYTADSYTDSIVIEGDIPVKNHVYGDPVWTWSEDGKSATLTFTCTACANEENHERVFDAIVDDGIVTKPQTCTIMGDTTYTGTFTLPETVDSYTAETYTASATRTDIEINGHVYGEPEWKWAKDGKSATLTFVCTVCTDEENHEITVDAEIADSVANAQTCTLMGTTRYDGTYVVPEGADTYTAESYNDFRLKRDIPANGHTYGEPEWTWSRKQTVAYIKFTCTECENEENHIREYNGVVETPVVVLEPTCTSVGKTQYEANFTVPESVDTYTQQTYNLTTILDDIKMLPHTKIITVEPIVATCTTPGRTVGTECTICGQVINVSVETEPSDHNLYASVKAIAPTCTTDGRTATMVCRVCGEIAEESEVLPKLGHKYEVVRVVKETCTTNGYTVYSCQTCGDTYEGKIIPAFGHSYKLVESATANCTTGGFSKYTCLTCGNTYKTDVVAPLGHEYITHLEKPATCLETGWNEYQTCSRCSYSTFKATPLADHADKNIDGKCDICSKVLNCGHICHSNGLLGLIVRFFRSVFKSKCCDDMEFLF